MKQKSRPDIRPVASTEVYHQPFPNAYPRPVPSSLSRAQAVSPAPLTANRQNLSNSPKPYPGNAPSQRGGEGKLLTKLGNRAPPRNSRELLNLSPRLELRHISQLTRGACYAIKSEHNLGKTVAGSGRAVGPWLDGLHGRTSRAVPHCPYAAFAYARAHAPGGFGFPGFATETSARNGAGNNAGITPVRATPPPVW